MIWYDMIWYTIWYDTIWHDMKWNEMIWYDIIWYDVIYMTYDMTIYDIIYDVIYDMIYYMTWYNMIWYLTWHDTTYDMLYDMTWYNMIWYMTWYDMTWYMIWLDMIYMIYGVVYVTIYDIRHDMIQYMIWYMTWHDMLFIYCDWFSTQWEWLVYIYQKERKGTVIYKRRKIHKRIPNFRIHKIEDKHKTRIPIYKECMIVTFSCLTAEETSPDGVSVRSTSVVQNCFFLLLEELNYDAN